jgi:predicted nucleic acid-binding protein
VPRFVDTNVLLYSISRRPSDKRKRQRAIEVLSSQDLALSAQVLQEFYVQATRVTRDDALSHDAAAGFMKAWSRFPVQEISLEIVNAALTIGARHHLSYWDSSIVAAAQALGCSELLTEDLNHGQRIGSVRIANPFRR